MYLLKFINNQSYRKQNAGFVLSMEIWCYLLGGLALALAVVGTLVCYSVGASKNYKALAITKTELISNIASSGSGYSCEFSVSNDKELVFESCNDPNEPITAALDCSGDDVIACAYAELTGNDQYDPGDFVYFVATEGNNVGGGFGVGNFLTFANTVPTDVLGGMGTSNNFNGMTEPYTFEATGSTFGSGAVGFLLWFDTPIGNTNYNIGIYRPSFGLAEVLEIIESTSTSADFIYDAHAFLDDEVNNTLSLWTTQSTAVPQLGDQDWFETRIYVP